MPRPHAVERLPLPDGRGLTADQRGGWLTLRLDAVPLERFAIECEGQRIVLVGQQQAADSAFALWAASYWLFANHPDCREVGWDLSNTPDAALRSGLLAPAPQGWLTQRDLFWQLPQPWIQSPRAASYPEPETGDGSGRPTRPLKPNGELYRRFDARLGQWVSLRMLDIELDLDRFNRWQNTPRVLHFWQEGGTLEQHRAYLERLATDPHTITAIGCFDDEPFAYFEVYWAKEDRIAPFYDAHDHDRGMHMLVGEEAHRGPHKVASWLSALAHYLFLDETRTQTIVAEPRADNARMITYMRDQGFIKEKEFDFPHKRAALLRLSRNNFFKECKLL